MLLYVSLYDNDHVSCRKYVRMAYNSSKIECLLTLLKFEDSIDQSLSFSTSTPKSFLRRISADVQGVRKASDMR